MITLGIDYGTTKIAVVSFDAEHPENSRAVSSPHLAGLADLPASHAEQDPGRVWHTILDLLLQFPDGLRQQVQAIGLTGQMHSMMLWNRDGQTSPVITWQDHRASADGSLAEFQRINPALADGFGLTTLAWFAKQHLLDGWEFAGSPLSWLACRLTGTTEPLIDHTFAASWGLWNLDAAAWYRDQLRALDIPERLLPRVVAPGSLVGKTRHVPGLPDGIPVLAALGDNQASVLGCAISYRQNGADGAAPSRASEDYSEIYLTLGTGAQLSVVLKPEELADLPSGWQGEIRPFLNGRFLAVNAPLCGGQGWAWLCKAINNILETLGVQTFPEHQLLDRLDELAVKADTNGLMVDARFLGARDQAGVKASISGIDLANFTLPALARALAAGLVRQLVTPFPPDLLHRRSSVIGSGNCVRLCQAIQQEITAQTGIPLTLRQIPEEAATGAAKLAAR